MGRDVHADAIVTKAKDTHVPLGDRAVEAVKSIVREYYDESMLSEVVYDENEGGLSTTPVGRGSDIKGKITVGKYFIEHIDAFARRVLQVGHELQHVQQQRDGMGGQRSQDKTRILGILMGRARAREDWNRSSSRCTTPRYDRCSARVLQLPRRR